jgi:surfeit locus 1 family protein
MVRRNVVFLVAAAAMAGLFVCLGVWQVSRLGERRAYNHMVASRLAEAAIPLRAVPDDSAQNHYRRVRFSGTFDFAHEVVLTDRVRDGAPGVYLVTPLHPDSGELGDTAVLVERGWVYAPDGMSVDETRWQELAHVSGTGYVIELAPWRGPAELSDRPRAFRWLDRAAVERTVGYPIADYTIVLEPNPASPGTPRTAAADAPRVPIRVSPPALDDGPHLSYAIQWFSFALIAIVGTAYALFIGPKRGRAVQWVIEPR